LRAHIYSTGALYDATVTAVEVRKVVVAFEYRSKGMDSRIFRTRRQRPNFELYLNRKFAKAVEGVSRHSVPPRFPDTVMLQQISIVLKGHHSGWATHENFLDEWPDIVIPLLLFCSFESCPCFTHFYIESYPSFGRFNLKSLLCFEESDLFFLFCRPAA
jgi:hypothetical protein